MEFKTFYITDGEGNIVPGAWVEVTPAGSTEPAAVFNSAGVPLPQPLVSDGQGRVVFAADNGVYDLAAQLPGQLAMVVLRRLQFFDPAEAATDALVRQQNLSDLTDVVQAKLNLGLGSAADRPASDFATASQGAAANGAAPQTRLVGTGTGLTGGGNLSADRTLAIRKADAADIANRTLDKVVTADVLPVPIFAKEFVSGQIALANGASLAVPHTLGAMPKLVALSAVRIGATADLGVDPGGEIEVAFLGTVSSGDSHGVAVRKSAAAIGLTLGALGFGLMSEAGARVARTLNEAPDGWRLVVRAWA